MKVAIDTAGVQNVVELAPIAMVADIVVEAVDTVEAADTVVGMAIGTAGVTWARTVVEAVHPVETVELHCVQYGPHTMKQPVETVHPKVVGRRTVVVHLVEAAGPPVEPVHPKVVVHFVHFVQVRNLYGTQMVN
jgi:hypothetical protein